MSCAIGLALLDVIEKEDLRGNATRVGTHLKNLLRKLQSQHQVIGDVRFGYIQLLLVMAITYITIVWLVRNFKQTVSIK